MAYSKFTALDLEDKFGIKQSYEKDLFIGVAPRKSSELLLAILDQNISFALEQGTEKARSELIIAPIFIELCNQTERQVNVFSGIEFNVDKKLGLSGWADFLVSRSTFRRGLKAPVVIAVEAKQQDFEGGVTQCIAEMYAANIFNEKRNNSTERIYGCVTTGDIWRFLVLENNEAKIETSSLDVREDLERILGILYAMALEKFD
jgi:hypothetical protein